MFAIVKLSRIRELENENDRLEQLERQHTREREGLLSQVREAHQFVGDCLRLSDDSVRFLRNAETRLRG